MNKKVVFFLKRQFQELKDEGVYALGRKFYTLLTFLLAPLGVIVIRLLRPFVVIRLGALISSRIGHFAANTELYLCERDASLHNSKAIDIFYTISPISNNQLKKMWKRKLHIYDFVRYIDRLNRIIPAGKIHKIPLPSERDVHNLLVNNPPHLSFTPIEERLGFEMMRNLGIPDKAEFICFYARDSAYLASLLPSQNWDYHSHRDVDIRNYLPAIKELVRQGYFTVRMGSVVKEPLNVIDSKIIDYAKNGRTDFLDIFLSAKCRFFISSFSGLDEVPRIFRRPIVYTNVIPLGVGLPFHCTPGNLFILKKIWLRKDNRFLTLREIITLGIWKFLKSQEYEQLGIEAVENTPEEITSVVMEMNERIKGAWQATEEDEKLQKRFWSILGVDESSDKSRVRVGAEFLRQNQELLQ